MFNKVNTVKFAASADYSEAYWSNATYGRPILIGTRTGPNETLRKREKSKVTLRQARTDLICRGTTSAYYGRVFLPERRGEQPSYEKSMAFFAGLIDAHQPVVLLFDIEQCGPHHFDFISKVLWLKRNGYSFSPYNRNPKITLAQPPKKPRTENYLVDYKHAVEHNQKKSEVLATFAPIKTTILHKRQALYHAARNDPKEDKHRESKKRKSKKRKRSEGKASITNSTAVKKRTLPLPKRHPFILSVPLDSHSKPPRDQHPLKLQPSPFPNGVLLNGRLTSLKKHKNHVNRDGVATALGTTREELVSVLCRTNMLGKRTLAREIYSIYLGKNKKNRPPLQQRLKTEWQHRLKQHSQAKDTLTLCHQTAKNTLSYNVRQNITSVDQLIEALDDTQKILILRKYVREVNSKKERLDAQYNKIFDHYMRTYLEGTLSLGYKSALLYAKIKGFPLTVWAQDRHRLYPQEQHVVQNPAIPIEIWVNKGQYHFSLLSTLSIQPQP